MYAAAGGASLASSRARRTKQRQHHTSDSVHNQIQKRFEQLQHQHAPACGDGYHYMRSSSGAIMSPTNLRSLTDFPGQNSTADFSVHDSFFEGKAAAAWLDRDRKSGISPSEIPLHIAAHRSRLKSTSEGHKKQRKVSSFGESSGDLRGGLRKQHESAANMLLYVGLCTISLGLVITFVGTGEKGFKTVELRLIGPIVIAFGLSCCSLRILLCFCPTKYMRRRFNRRYKKQTATGVTGDDDLNVDGGGGNRRVLAYCSKHLPFQPMANNPLLFQQSCSQQPADLNNKPKRLGMPPHTRRVAYDLISETASEQNLSTLRELSPLREEDLIDFQHCSNSFENLSSLDSSLEYLNVPLDNQVLEYYKPCVDNPFVDLSKEQMDRLKSTLTFGDSKEFATEMQIMSSYDEFDLHDDPPTFHYKKEPVRPTRSVGFIDKDDNSPKPLSSTKAADLASNHELVLSAGSLQQKS